MSQQLFSVSQSVEFSCAHRYALTGGTEQENRQLYGESYSPEGLGHNFTLQATVCGSLDPQQGSLWPQESFQSELKTLVSMFDHKFVEKGLHNFPYEVSSVENMAQFLAEKLQSRMPERLVLQRLRLFEDAGLWVDIFPGQPPRLSKSYRIRCVHRHHNPNLSMQENQRLYHKCSAVHGHEYKIEVTLQGDVDPRSGVIMPRAQLDQVLGAQVIVPLDGSFLNEHLGNTSGEIICERLYRMLKPHLPLLLTLSLRETKKNSFFYLPETLEPVEVFKQI